MSTPPDAPRSAGDAFPTTHWSRVVAARERVDAGARDALAALCRDYWYPLYAFVRRRGMDPDRAADLVQEYFARLIEGDLLGKVDRRKGRFRAFLRADCGFFLAHQAERERTGKRGGDRAHVPIDARDAEGRYLREEPADTLTPERLFDRAWALSLLDGVLGRLAREYADSGRAAQFEQLQVVLAEGRGAVPYTALAARLGTTEAAVQQAVRRLRARYRAILREQIAATLDDPSEAAIDEEIRDLFAALGG